MKASVIIPTYNRYQQLKALLDSLNHQNIPKNLFEIIIVDDGSCDQTRDITYKFNEFLKIEYFFQKNQGPSASRNRGVERAKGEIIIFSDDDMIAPSNWIQQFLQAFDKNPKFAIIQAGCIYSKISCIFGETTSYFSSMADKLRILPSKNFSEGLEADYIGTGNLAIHKERLSNFKLWFDERLITREDEDLFRSLKKANVAIGFIHNPLLHNPSLGIISDIKRYFHYGQGEYLLRQKWGNYERLRYDRSFKSIREVFGFKKGGLVMLILYMRAVAWQCGYWKKSLKGRS